jgi:8-oxo-dGTP diphosphatase
MGQDVREWVVAGALVESGGRVLLVRNQRRGGLEDWSTPGGVIDDEDGSVLDGLTREVEEETGLRVTRWEGPLYEVEAVAPDLGWVMRCEVHRAVAYEGHVRVADPDGIVVEAAFVSAADAATVLERCHPWVGEPLAEWLAEPWGPDASRRYCYELHGVSRAALEVVRTDLTGRVAPAQPNTRHGRAAGA